MVEGSEYRVQGVFVLFRPQSGIVYIHVCSWWCVFEHVCLCIDNIMHVCGTHDIVHVHCMYPCTCMYMYSVCVHR